MFALCGPPARQLRRFVAAVARSLPTSSIRVVASGITPPGAEIYLQARAGQNQSAAVTAARPGNDADSARTIRVSDGGNVVNVILGILTLFITNVLTGLFGQAVLPALLIHVALTRNGPPLWIVNLLGSLGLDTVTIAAVCGTGFLFAHARPGLTFRQGIVIAALFLGLPLLLLLRPDSPFGAGMIFQAMPFRLVTVLAFFFPAAIGALRRGEISQLTLRTHMGAMAGLLALSLFVATGGPVHFEPLRPEPGLPRFGEAAAATRALSQGDLPLEESRKHERRAAVRRAAEQVRATPCDAGARDALRAALVELLNNHIPAWYAPPSETMYAGGGAVNATRQLDAPALAVYRDALAAGIIQPDALSERAQRELRFTHLGAADPKSGLVCSGG